MNLINEVGLNHYDAPEWLIRTDMKASQDNLINRHSPKTEYCLGGRRGCCKSRGSAGATTPSLYFKAEKATLKSTASVV